MNDTLVWFRDKDGHNSMVRSSVFLSLFASRSALIECLTFDTKLAGNCVFLSTYLFQDENYLVTRDELFRSYPTQFDA